MYCTRTVHIYPSGQNNNYYNAVHVLYTYVYTYVYVYNVRVHVVRANFSADNPLTQ